MHQLAERRIDKSLPSDSGFACEDYAFDPQGEVALAFGIVSAVAAMLLALVRELDAARGKCRIEPAKHLSRDRTGSLRIHRSYIRGFDGDETIQYAWTGRRGSR